MKQELQIDMKDFILHGKRYGVEILDDTSINNDDIILGTQSSKKRFILASISYTNDSDEYFHFGEVVIVDSSAIFDIDFKGDIISLVNTVDIVGVFNTDDEDI